ncbi:ABC transporter permease [Bacillus massiliigorillae]|uniref:ABC transporter permease n=1 Tax=Bacillus massiliigorillae TaxID=1243664 RepID=UPI00039AA944|nr:ABC transporter permease [Bacillus massiliigorillae]
MTFSAIIRKNFIYNIKKFMSMYFVNTLIVAMLFIFGSLMFNSDVLEQVGQTTLYETIKSALLVLVLFSIVFITYSNISFLKYRGKEFGMYITLGMTTKDLIKLLFIENIGILFLSIGSGLLSGAVFGKFFYLGLNKMLPFNPVDFEVHVNSFLLSIGVFLIIFICNFIFSIFYIKRSSVIDILRSSNKKEIGKNSVVFGGVALFLFVVSAYLIPKILLNKIFKGQLYTIYIFIFLTIACPYVIIGTLIVLYKAAIKRFEKTYNNQLLLLSNLSHRFLAYKNSLYIVSLLLGVAIFFVGLTYSFYSSSEIKNDKDNPYDVMFLEENHVNNISQDEVEKALQQNGSSITQYDKLDYIDVAEFKDLENDFVLWSEGSSVVSESNFSKHMKKQYNVKPNNMISVRVHSENMDYEKPNTILSVSNEKQVKHLQSQLEGSTDSKEEKYKELQQSLKGNTFVAFDSKNIKEITEPFTNYHFTRSYMTGDILVVDDEVYETLLQAVGLDKVKTMHLIKGDISKKDFRAFVSVLSPKNGLDPSTWLEKTSHGYGANSKGDINDYRPTFKDEQLALQLESNGFIFFIMIFMGVLFTIASGVVLYYKVLTDIDEEKERIISLKRIGITFRELQRMVSRELAVTFFLPTLIGMGLGMYYIYVMFSNDIMRWTLLMKSGLVCVVFLVIQVVLYFICRRKYFSELSK